MQKLRLWLASPRWPFAVALVAVVLTLPALATGFVLDDFTHRLMLDPAGPVHRAPWNLFCFYGDNCGSDPAMQHLGLLPWWASRGLRLSFFRPLTSLSHALDYVVFPRVPALMHAESIALYAALCGLVAVLYRRLLGATSGMILSLLPLCATWPNDRLLLLVGFGAFGIVAMFLAAVGEVTRPLRWAAMPLAGFLALVHLVAAPLLMPIRIVELPPIFKRLVTRAAATLWHDGRSADTIDVIVNAPDAVTLLHASATRILESGEAVQRRLLLLSVAVVGRIAVERVDGRTIAIDFSDGFPRDLSSRLFRDQGEAFAAGDDVRAEGVVVRIAACAPEKGPTRIVYRFDLPLEDPRLNWLVWQDTGFVSYRPPPVGAREERAAIDWREAAGIVATRARP